MRELRLVHGVDRALELTEDEAYGRFVALRRAGERRHVERICFSVLIDLGLCVRIDERHLDAITARCRDEEELITVRDRLLDDRGGDRRQEVLLQRALERPRAELGAEALLDEERVRRLVDLDGPRPAAKASTCESVGELLVEERAHRGSLEWPEDDDPIETVYELRTERRTNGTLDAGAREGSRRRVEADARATGER